jgi:hypothetical protein
MPSVDRETAIALLDVQPARVVAITTADGTLFDEDGDAIDQRQTVPWVMALGPFGSWPARLEEAIADLQGQTDFATGRSFRLGRVVLYKSGWGYAIKPIPMADANRALAAALRSPLDALTPDQLDAAMNGGVEVTVRLWGGRWVATAATVAINPIARGDGTTAAVALEALADALVKLADAEVSGG